MSNNLKRKLMRSKLKLIKKCRECDGAIDAAGTGRERCDECLKSGNHCNFKKVQKFRV